MPYVEPTAADLKARFPEFDLVPDAQINAVLEETKMLVAAQWHEETRRLAQIYHAAHTLACEGSVDATGSYVRTTSNVQNTVTMRKIGEVTVQYGQAGGSGLEGDGNAYSMTKYGQKFQDLAAGEFIVQARMV